MTTTEDKIVLNVTGVQKTFGGLQALSNINLKIKEGETHAIMAPMEPVSRRCLTFASVAWLRMKVR